MPLCNVPLRDKSEKKQVTVTRTDDGGDDFLGSLAAQHCFFCFNMVFLLSFGTTAHSGLDVMRFSLYRLALRKV